MKRLITLMFLFSAAASCGQEAEETVESMKEQTEWYNAQTERYKAQTEYYKAQAEMTAAKSEYLVAWHKARAAENNARAEYLASIIAEKTAAIGLRELGGTKIDARTKEVNAKIQNKWSMHDLNTSDPVSVEARQVGKPYPKK